MTDQTEPAERLEGIRRALAFAATDRPTPEQIAEREEADKATAQRIRAVLPGVPLHHTYAVLQALRVRQGLDAAAAAPAGQAPATDRAAPRCVCGDPIEWYTAPGGGAGWVHSPASDGPILDVHKPRPAAEAQLAADRAAVLREAADALATERQIHSATGPNINRRNPLRARGMADAETLLRRMADEAQQPEPQADACAHCGKTILRITGTLTAWWVHDPGGHTICDPQQAASSPRATPKPAVEAQQPETQAVPPIAYSGKGRAFCLTCPRPADEDVPLTANDIEPYKCCAACGRDLRDVAEARQLKEARS